MQAELTLIATFGRSGSTMLMHALSHHPEVLMWRAFPYEHRIAQYMVTAARTGLPVDFGPVHVGAARCIGAHADDHVIKRALAAATRDTSWRTSPQAATQQVYADIARSQGGQARHIFEKGLGVSSSIETLKSWPNSRFILLSRDPRSVFLSVKAFNRKRDFVGFGAEQGDRALFDNIVNFTRDARRQVAAHPRALELRYEDLLNAPGEGTQSLLAFCDLGADASGLVAGALFDRSPRAVDHMTLAPRDGIERWRAEANEAQRAMFSRRAETLAEIGYP